MNLQMVLIRAIFGALILIGVGDLAQAYQAPYQCSRSWYVSTTGTDNSTCGTQSAPCATMQGANNASSIGGSGGTLEAGDCVNVAAGTYSSGASINLTVGGSSNTATGYIVYKGAGMNNTVLQFDGVENHTCLNFIANYLVLDGLGISNCYDYAINAGATYANPGYPHHLMVLNSQVTNAGGGIGFESGDYYIIAGNVIHGMTGGQYVESGISIYDPAAIPGFSSSLAWDTQQFHIQVLENTSYANQTPAQDGEGIIFDNWSLSQWTASGNPGAYPYPGLVAGNVVYDNAGRGIQITGCANGCQVWNNTAYNDNQYANSSATYRPELQIDSSNNAVVKNNALYAVAGSGSLQYNTALLYNNSSGATITDNDTYQVNSNSWNSGTCSPSIYVTATGNDAGNCSTILANNSLHDTNPQFTSLTAPDFHPVIGSPLLGAGAALPTGVLPNAPTTIDGQTFTNPPSIGPYNASQNTVAGPVAISAGGPDASPFIADAGYNGGTGQLGYNGAIDTSLLTNPPPQSVLQYQRWGPSFYYVISGLTNGGQYNVNLWFTEDHDTASGQRQENVAINGVQVLTNFDIFAAAGAQHKAIEKSFASNADSNGNITITFSTASTTLADPNAKIDALQVIPAVSAPVAVNETASTAYNTGAQVNLNAGATGSPTSATVVGTPSGGTVTLNGLTATFTPNAGFSGSGSFQFTLSNAGGASNTATAMVTVGAPPQQSGKVEDFQYLSADWYLPDLVLPATASPSATGPNIIRCAPGGLRNKATIGNVGARVFTADAAGHLEFAIYTNGSNQRPANLAATSASMSAAAPGVITSTLSTKVQGGSGGANVADTFWFCANSDSSVARFASINSVPSIEASVIGSALAGNVLQGAGNGVAISHLSTSQTYGSWPSSLAGAAWTEQTSIAMPTMAVQFVSVP